MDCKYFDGCSAPLCPRDEGVADRTWFPDEDICRLADVPDWVKQQRKFARKAAQGGYFTVAMLRHDCRIAQGIKGVDPDGTNKERAADETAWFKNHPALKPKTPEELEKSRDRMLQKWAVKRGRDYKNTPSNVGLDDQYGKKGIQVPPAPERA
ncbi:MAG: hypothetical protein LBQ44_04435 [Treponema sp.]|jgi:hypothetical protein|nr:hypothetical protein [Treponema sp.]